MSFLRRCFRSDIVKGGAAHFLAEGGLHGAEGSGEFFGEGVVAEGFDVFGGEGFSVEDCDASEFGVFLGSWPAFEDAVDDHRQDGRAAASAHQAKAGLDGTDASVGGARAFGIEADGLALLEEFNDGLHRGDVGLTFADGDDTEGSNQPSPEAVLQQGVAGDKIKRPPDPRLAEHRVKKALVVADDQKGAVFGDVFFAIDLHSVQQRQEADRKYLADPVPDRKSVV